MTNLFLNLPPFFEALAHSQGLHAILIVYVSTDSLSSRSDWVLISDDPSALRRKEIAEAATEIEPRRDWRLWTDDYNNLFQVLK